MKIAVHDSKFHADDVFAIAILKLIYPKAEIIRTRDEQKLKQSDMRIDVGKIYNPKTQDFDHHQSTFNEKRSTGIPYASAGLIWKHFGEKLTNKEIKEYIDKRIIQFIDAHDTGVNTFKSDIPIYTIAHFIDSLNPSWPNESLALYDKRFNEAVKIVSTLLKNEIEKEENLVKARTIIQEKIDKAKEPYIIIEDLTPWKETVIPNPKLKFVVRHDTIEKNWSVHAIPLSINSFGNRYDLPKAWGGLSNSDLQKVTGVNDAVFCHKNLFIAVAKSKDGALALVKLALKGN